MQHKISITVLYLPTPTFSKGFHVETISVSAMFICCYCGFLRAISCCFCYAYGVLRKKSTSFTNITLRRTICMISIKDKVHVCEMRGWGGVSLLLRLLGSVAKQQNSRQILIGLQRCQEPANCAELLLR